MREGLFIVVPIFAGIMVGAYVLIMASRHPPRRVIGAIREFSGMLNKKSRKLGVVREIEVFLTKNGARYHYGRSITWIGLVCISIFLSLTGFFVGERIGIAVAIVFCVILGAGPWIMLPILNQNDNERLLPDLQMIYHALAMQIKAGVYVTDALSECYTSVREIRLREALIDLGSDIVMKSDLFSALEKFQSKFDNRYIDSLCITILQSMESGQATSLLSDLADQVRDMEKAVLEKRKGRLDRSLTFYQLGMLACILAVALYACVNYMLLAAINM